jgi:hypothetical protein
MSADTVMRFIAFVLIFADVYGIALGILLVTGVVK